MGDKTGIQWTDATCRVCGTLLMDSNRVERGRRLCKSCKSARVRSAYIPKGRPGRRGWLGVSVEDQASADERIPILLQTPAAVRFLSVEPLLEPVKLYQAFDCLCGGLTATREGLPRVSILCPLCDRHQKPLIDWVIVGGESGPHARPCNIEWIRSVVAQCKAAGVPCFVKQLGAVALDSGYPLELRDSKGGDPSEWPEDLRVREFPE